MLDSKTSIVLICLTVEALKLLGVAQVLDLGSTWNVIKSKLEHNTSPLVLQSLCDFFSVVPAVVTNSQEYEEFKECSLTFLWGIAFHENIAVSGQAFNALSKFCPTDFKIRYLPNKISQPIIEHLKNSPKIKRMMDEREEDEEEMIDFGSFPIPGYFYIEFLQQIPVALHQAYTGFLNTIVQEEVSHLPRSLSYNVMKRQERSESKIMASIPVLLQTQYEKCKQPSLKPSIAASLLFCNEVKNESRGGKQIRSEIVIKAKSYRNMLNNLLHEVPVQTSEGPRNVKICLAWTTFMTKLFQMNVEGRRTELVMQKDRGHINDDELNSGLENSWLWVRDLLTDQLKAASKGTHLMQGNSLLALAGLANAVFQYRNSVERNTEEIKPSTTTDKDVEQKPMPEWIAAVVDTFLVILDGNLKTFGDPMDWCQQISSVTSSASSVLARSCAALALSQLVPALIAQEFDRIQQIILVLHIRIPGQTKAGSSSVIQSHCSLGMGLVLKQLYHENFSNFFGQEGDLLLSKGLDALETASFSLKLDNTGGAVYALGLVMTSLFRDSSVPVRMHGKNTYDKIIKFYESQKNENGAKLQDFSLAVAYSTISLFETELLEPESVLKTALDLQQAAENFPKDREVMSAFGLLVHGLRITGGVSVEEMFLKWEKHWRSLTSDNSLPTNHRVAALSGLAAIYGSEQTLLMLENPEAIAKSYIENGVKSLKQLLQSCKDVSLIGNILWYLGRLSLSSNLLLNNQTTLPDNLDYLGEDSVLNYLIHLLLDYGKAGGSMSSENIEILNTSLRVLTEGPKHPLPPLNWLAVLHPFVKHSFGNKTIELCVNLGLSSTSPTATGTFLSTWLSPSVWMSLEINCQILLYLSLDQLVRIVSTKKVRELVEYATKLFSDKQIEPKLAEAVLTGLCSILRMSDPPKSIITYVKETIALVFLLLPDNYEPEDQAIFSKLAACLENFSSEEAEKLTEPTKENVIKSLMIRKQLLIHNKTFTWALVKPCIDLALSIDIIFDVLPHIVSTISCFSIKNLGDIVEWTIQLLNNLGLTNISNETTNAIFLVLIVLILVTGGDHVISITMALRHQNNFIDDHRGSYKEWLFTIINCLPEIFSALLEKPEWKFPVEKVIDKLLCLLDSSSNQTFSRLILQILLQFRRFDVYEKRSIWTQVVSYV